MTPRYPHPPPAPLLPVGNESPGPTRHGGEQAGDAECAPGAFTKDDKPAWILRVSVSRLPSPKGFKNKGGKKEKADVWITGIVNLHRGNLQLEKVCDGFMT